jgi:RNA polymerase sigma factor (sigma-70 family)
MAKPQLDNVLYHIRKLAGERPEEDCTDGQLLEHFISRRDETAFTTLVERHGPLVLGVCQRVLANDADAADAFQATFLVLARKAASIRNRESVGSWLYGVAYRLARKAQVEAARRRVHERQVEPMPRSDPLAAVVWRDLRPVLDEELDKLGEKYRAPLVLCYLEGKTHEEAARQLGWTNGTVCGRLFRAREILRRRLTRRGLGLSAGLLTTVLSQQAAPAVSASLTVATVKAALLVTAGHSAAGLVSAQAAWLVQTLMKAWFLARVKMAVAVLLAVCLLGAGAGVWLLENLVSPPPASDTEDEPPPDTETGQVSSPGVLRLSGREPVFCVAFSPDGKVLASGDGGRHLRLWQVATGNELTSVVAHQDEVSAVAFSPAGQILASAGYDRLVRLWDAATGKPLRTLAAHEDHVSALAFSPDGTLLASAGWDRQIHLWDVATGTKLRSLAKHRDRIWSIAFSPDGQMLASGSGDKTIWLWDVATGNHLCRLVESRSAIYAVAFSPDGRLLASSENNQVVLREAVTGQEVRQVKGSGTAIVYFTFSPDGRTLAWTDADHGVHLWEVATGADRLYLEGHHQTVGSLAFSPDGKRLASGSVDASIRLSDLAKQSRNNQPAKGPLSPRRIESLWTDLGGDDAVKAYAAIWALTAVPEQAVPFLKDQLPRGAEFRGRLARLIAELDHDAFAVREKASADLKKFGPSAGPTLRQVLAGQPSPEVRRRVENLLAEIDKPRGEGPAADYVQAVRALEALELMATPAARQLLQNLADGALDARVAHEAKSAGERLTKRLETKR